MQHSAASDLSASTVEQTAAEISPNDLDEREAVAMAANRRKDSSESTNGFASLPYCSSYKHLQAVRRKT
jgi:hypothetical protein